VARLELSVGHLLDAVSTLVAFSVAALRVEGLATAYVATRGGRAPAPAAGAAWAAIRLRVCFAMRALLFVNQRLTIGDRNLIVVGMDFAERQEAVAVAAVFDERGLQRGFNPRHLGEIDIAS
jgi:hypothetical protein